MDHIGVKKNDVPANFAGQNESRTNCYRHADIHLHASKHCMNLDVHASHNFRYTVYRTRPLRILSFIPFFLEP